MLQSYGWGSPIFWRKTYMVFIWVMSFWDRCSWTMSVEKSRCLLEEGFFRWAKSPLSVGEGFEELSLLDMHPCSMYQGMLSPAQWNIWFQKRGRHCLVLRLFFFLEQRWVCVCVRARAYVCRCPHPCMRVKNRSVSYLLLLSTFLGFHSLSFLHLRWSSPFS